MKKACLLFLIMLTLGACAHLPEIYKVEDRAAADRIAACTAIFPKGKWQFVHAVEILPPMGSKQTVLGIVQLSSEHRTIHSVLMTIEGLVIFEADYDGKVSVQRAVPPLDSPGMANGILHDISLLFLMPEQPCTDAGPSKDAAWICRYPYAGKGNEDIVLESERHREIRCYNKRHRLMRKITLMTGENQCAGGWELPSNIVLKAYGLGGYEIKMNLIEATPLDK